MVQVRGKTFGGRRVRSAPRAFLLVGCLAAWAGNACGGRTVWIEEYGEAGAAGDGGSGGDGGDGGTNRGGSGAGGSRGGYGGTGGVVAGTGGSVSGAAGTGGTGGTSGGFGGTFGGGPAGGTSFGGTGAGGVAGSSAGSAGVGACGATAGTGSGGVGGVSPGLVEACRPFCRSFPYGACASEGLTDYSACFLGCSSGFGLGSWCEQALHDFLLCSSRVLNPNASCMLGGDGLCYGQGCLSDALTQCAFQYLALVECQATPRPPEPCPPPPDPPLPPECARSEGVGPDVCERVTSCPGASYATTCYYQYQNDSSWLCECNVNGTYIATVTVQGGVDSACRSGATACGFP